MRLAAVGLALLGSLASAAETAAPAGGTISSREAGLPFFDVVNPRDYRGHFQVWDAVEDSSGLIYFGNYGQILVYDGATWDRVALPGVSFVMGLAIDEQDVLWVGAINEVGYAAADANGRRTFVSLRDRLPAEARECGAVRRVVLTKHGVLFQSNTWLLRWDGTRFATLPLASPSGWQLAAIGDSLWVSHEQLGWFTLADNGAELTLLTPQVRPPEFEGSALNFAISGDAPGQFILGSTRHGLVNWDGKSFRAFPTEIDDLLLSKRLYRGIRLKDGRIALTTLQAGAHILDRQGRLLASLDEDAGMPDNVSNSFLQARDGSLWITMRRGMVRVDVRPWLTWFGPNRGAPRSRVEPPVRFGGELFICSPSGLMRLVPSGRRGPARLEPVPEMPDFLNAIVVVDDVMIGLGENGILEWDGKTARPLPGRQANAFAFVAASGQPGRWFAVGSGSMMSYRREAGHWIFEGPVPDLAEMRSIAAEPNGTWWMGSQSDGVLRVTFPQATENGPGRPEIIRYTAGHGLPHRHGWVRVVVDGHGPLMRCERGLFRFDADRDEFVPTAEFGARFADGTTTTGPMLRTHGREGIWLTPRPTGEALLATDGEFGSHGDAGWRDMYLPHLPALDNISDLAYEQADDVLWLTAHSGLVRVDLALWRQEPPAPAPAVVVRWAETADGTRLAPAGGWQLPYSRRSLSVRFAAPSLAGDPAATYESTLLSEGDSVVHTDANPQREFSALAHGDYTLRLRARRGDGRWSEPVTLAFAVRPPWWRSPAAWTAYALLGVAGVFALVGVRTRALHRRAEQLEAVVATRTEDLRRSNVELARLHRLELVEKAAVKLSEEKARLELLRYQLNPHFLLNTFTTLRSLIFSRAESAAEMVGRLADFCRMALTRTDEAGGTVADEAMLIETYLATEKSRWRDDLTCSVETDPQVAAVRLPPFLLQPLVENAVKYGGRTSPERLEVAVRIAGDGATGLRIEVANTGQWVDGDDDPHRQNSTGIGLDNLRQRLRRYYPEAHALDVQSTAGWVRVLLHLQQPARDPFAASHAAH